MNNKFESKITEEIIICLSILFLFLYAAFNKIDLVQHELDLYSWATGDWLINYSAGFNRRGFIGQLILYLHKTFNLNPISIILKLREILYQIIFVGFFCIALKKRFGFVELILSASPWFFMFVINDELATGRKDILFLACLTIFVVFNLFTYRSIRSNLLSLINFIYLFFCLPLLILSHEGLFFFIQFFLLFLFLLNGINKKDFIVFLFPFLISLVVFILCYLYKGNQDIATIICNSLIDIGLNSSLCEGPIQGLAGFGVEFHAMFLPMFFLVLFLSFAPLLLYARFVFNSAKNKEVFFLSALSLIPIIPLFFVAADWGRWINIAASSLFLVFLSTKQTELIKFIFTPVYTIIFLIVAYMYVFNWKLSHFSGRYDDFNWFFNSFQLWIRSFNLW